MTSGYTSWQDRIEGTVVCRKSGEDVGEVAIGRSQDANMLCISAEGNLFGSKSYRVDNFPVGN